MSDRLREMPVPELEHPLVELGHEIQFPSAPGLPAVVGRRLRTPGAGRRLEDTTPAPSTAPIRFPRDSRRTLLLVAAVLLAVFAVAAAVRLSIGSVTIREDREPSAPPTAVESGTAVGRPTTLERAQASVGFEISLPRALGSPDFVAVDRPPGYGERVVLAWDPGEGLPPIEGLPYGALLTEFHGDLETAGKLVFEGSSRYEELEFDGRPAVWITGRHELDLPTSSGVRRFLVTGNVLLWEHEGVTLRLETALSMDQAILVARSVA
jgi:hypothetical protein